MKFLIPTFIFFFLTLFHDTQAQLNYQVNPGIRIDSATTRKAVFRNDTVFVYYGYTLWDGTQNTIETGLAIATDAPDFNLFTKVNIDSFRKYNFTLLPDGVTWRRYFKGSSGDSIQSESTTTGWMPSMDQGSRYTLDPSDNGTFGVHSTLVDAQNNVHMYYMGDMGNQLSDMNNIRHAKSTDGGDNFTFMDDNVCGDLGWGGFFTYVDPDVALLQNGDIRMYAMNPHGYNPPASVFDSITSTIHCFYSSDNGDSYTLEPTLTGSDTIVQCSDFGVHSLNDPKVVQLPDGRMKVFVNGLTFDGDSTYNWNIYSFSSMPIISNVDEETLPEVRIYPNPSANFININSPHQSTVEVYDLNGRLLMQKGFRANHQLDVQHLVNGVYVIRLTFQNQAVRTEKFVKH